LKRYIFITLVLFACQKGPLKKSGKLMTELRQLESFNALDLGSNIEVYLKQSDTPRIEITFGKNLLSGIKTEVTDGKLTIYDRNTLNWLRDLKKHAICTLWVQPGLRELMINESAQVRSIDTIKGGTIKVVNGTSIDQELLFNMGVVNGSCEYSGAMTLKGKANILAWTVKKGSFLNSSQLNNDDTYLFHFTINDCFVAPKIRLEATLGNSGNAINTGAAAGLKIKKGQGQGMIIDK
jgi:hypothetical protein